MRDARLEHPWAVRFSHWLIALAMAVLVPSGLEIFAAFPGFGDKIPDFARATSGAPQQDWFAPPTMLRLGGWLGGAIQWHMTFAWLLIGAGTLYAVYQLASGNARQVLFAPRDLPGVWPMVRHYFLFGPKPPQTETYNPLQKLAYTSAIGLTCLVVLTGVALYKAVQLGWLVAAFGGFRAVRVLHFAAMCGLLAFIPGHLVMVVLHGWSNFASMWTGSRYLKVTNDE
jgi:Ni/Fe-hydrogenase b-type cytochrome subunit